jgi:high-affinity Fe2+/Pb2+ permease
MQSKPIRQLNWKQEREQRQRQICYELVAGVAAAVLSAFLIGALIAHGLFSK